MTTPQLRAPKYRILGDVFIIYWLGLVADLLPQLDAVLDKLDGDSAMREEPVRNYLLLVKDSTGDYNGLLPDSLYLRSNIRQPYSIAWFHEEDQDRALTKVKLAYDLGLDTNPTM